jgi:putative transposase
VFWKHLDRAPVPFGELAWDHARRNLGREATGEQIADAVTALLRRANAGPGKEKPKMSKRDRRAAARTKAAGPAADQDQPGPRVTEEPAPPAADEDGPLAKVIPMKIFDPFAEADKRW